MSRIVGRVFDCDKIQVQKLIMEPLLHVEAVLIHISFAIHYILLPK